MDKILLAPIKGITDLVYRKTYYQHYKGVTRAVAPFFVLSDKGGFKEGTIKRTLGQEATPTDSCPQILSRKGTMMAQLSQILKDLGFPLLNWNLGCPFPKVANKYRGSGLLPYPDEIRTILDDFYKHKGGDLEVKIRLGWESEEELEPLINVFNDYPITLLIIHPRFGIQRYSGSPHLELFEWAYKNYKGDISYNGDIYTRNDYVHLKERFPKVHTWMIGRGLLKNPDLALEILDNKYSRTPEKLYEFIMNLMENYRNFYPDPGKTVNMVKAHLYYLCPHWSANTEIVLAAKRAKSIKELSPLIRSLIAF
ncbi:tRNA-dihydrouridine synthase family protein [Spirochaeta cellobiosiphila]|uniref:tRNA-dihydrouridine synthase family protein n=1 Tax=Spirochaeta cellobiosiphila TaxID=504483 RepID=UPI0004065D79|nr:tRNA-dihydrouridine synthase family protein [Spirochaeta cellobiosiphila]